MVEKKSVVVNFRTDPIFRERLRYAADLEHRNISNFIEMVLTKYCDDRNIKVPEQTKLPMDDPHE